MLGGSLESSLAVAMWGEIVFTPSSDSALSIHFDASESSARELAGRTRNGERQLLEIEALLESMHLLVIQRLGFQDREEIPSFRRKGSVAATGEKLRCRLMNEGTGVVSTHSRTGVIAIA